MNKATVIIPTTGSVELYQAVDSVLKQDVGTICQVVVDGSDHVEKVLSILAKFKDNPNLRFSVLHENVGANGFYGHRIYAAFVHLVNTPYVLFLDQDNWLESWHVRFCVEKIEQENLFWCYSLRKIVDSEGKFLLNDDCESLGKWESRDNIHHVDTNCYCVRTDVAIQLGHSWHNGWGADRQFYSVISQHANNYGCTGDYTVNYRLGGNEGSVKKEFFEQGNKMMEEKYKDGFPWRKV